MNVLLKSLIEASTNNIEKIVKNSSTKVAALHVWHGRELPPGPVLVVDVVVADAVRDPAVGPVEPAHPDHRHLHPTAVHHLVGVALSQRAESLQSCQFVLEIFLYSEDINSFCTLMVLRPGLSNIQAMSLVGISTSLTPSTNWSDHRNLK